MRFAPKDCQEMTEGGFQFLYAKNFIYVNPLLKSVGKTDKNFVITHDDDDDDNDDDVKILPMEPTLTINNDDNDEENDEVNVDDDDDADDDEEELSINDVILVGDDDDWSKDSYSRKCADDAEYDSIEEEEQILRKYTADQNRTKIRSHFDANSKSPSILLASPSGSAAASLLQYKDYIDSSRPQVADRSYSILRKPPMSQRRWVDCSNQVPTSATSNPDQMRTHNLHLRDRSKIKRKIRVDEEEEMREELERERQKIEKLKKEEEKKSLSEPDAMMVDIQQTSQPPRRRQAQPRQIKRMFHTELERERRSELRKLYGQLHDAIWETACTDQLPDLVALGHAINSKTKICTIEHATFAIKALEKENVVLEAMRTVLKHENQRLKATLRQLQPKAKPEVKLEVELEAKPELKPEENDDDYDDSGYVVNVKEEVKKKNVSRGKKGGRRKGKRKAKGW